MKNFILITSLLFAATAHAAPETTTKATVEGPKSSGPSRFSFGVSTMMWQEDVKASLAAAPIKMRGQAYAFGLEAAYERMIDRKARWFWTANVGVMKGAAIATLGSTSFKNSSLFGGYLQPGIFRRQTLKSEFGFIFPIMYRTVTWETLDNTLKPEDDNKIGYGFGPKANFVFNNGNYLSMSLVYQMKRPSAMWIISYDWR